jgi:hypothetical protein
MTNGTGRLAFRFVLTIGIVNLFADMTYGGARGITGPVLSLSQSFMAARRAPLAGW